MVRHPRRRKEENKYNGGNDNREEKGSKGDKYEKMSRKVCRKRKSRLADQAVNPECK